MLDEKEGAVGTFPPLSSYSECRFDANSYSCLFAYTKQQTGGKKQNDREIGPHTVGPLTRVSSCLTVGCVSSLPSSQLMNN